jgi:hypothetical protein
METLAAPKTVKQALDAIAREHATPETYMDAAKKTLEQATAFVREKGLLTLPTRSNLQVIETPEFLRGIYGVGGFNAAPALQPELGAFYWITPIPKTWAKERIESKLREYNNYGMQELTFTRRCPATTCSSRSPTTCSRRPGACCAACSATDRTSRAGASTCSS